MQSYNSRTRSLAACLSTLAGFIDAVGYLGTGGFFVSFMSGNSTRFAVGLAGGTHAAVVALGLLVTFIAGVTAGAVLSRISAARDKTAVLLLVAAALAIAAGLPTGLSAVRFAAAAFAMGAVNMTLETGGEIRIGLTYMTGTLVKIGQRLATALLGGERWGWLPFLMLWSGLIFGAVAGAVAYSRLGLGALWIAAAGAVGLAIVVRPGARGMP